MVHTFWELFQAVPESVIDRERERDWKTFTSRSILPALVLQRLAEWASLFPSCYFSAIHVQGLVIEASWLQRSEA